MKNKIIKLRKEGKTYNEIVNVLGVNKSTISYHCKLAGLDGRIDGKGLDGKNIEEIKDFYKTHTMLETKKEFNLCSGTIKKIVERKNKKLSEEERKAYNYEHVKSFRKKNKLRAVNNMGGKCQICGYDKCLTALEFHHLDPTKKDFALSQNMNMSWDKISEEIEKCILVCANCHREIHEGITLVSIRPV